MSASVDNSGAAAVIAVIAVVVVVVVEGKIKLALVAVVVSHW